MTDQTEPAPNRITLEFSQPAFEAICDAASHSGLPLHEWAMGILLGDAQFLTLTGPEFIDAALERIIALSNDITAVRIHLSDNPPPQDERN